MSATKARYSRLNRIIQRIASTRPGGELGRRVLHHADRAVLRLTGGRRTLASWAAGIPVVVLTTTGARSGKPRTLPLLCLRDEQDPDTLFVIASKFGSPHHPGWYYNLKANPLAVGAIEGQTRRYLAHEVEGEAYDRCWRQAVETYFGFALYKQRAGERRIPIFALAPAERNENQRLSPPGRRDERPAGTEPEPTEL